MSDDAFSNSQPRPRGTYTLVNNARSEEYSSLDDTRPSRSSTFVAPTTFRSFSGLPDRDDEKTAFHRQYEDRRLQGYPLFAHFMSQRGYGIFRQFSHLNMRHLLYLQAKILEMEEELDKLEREIIKVEEQERYVPFSFVVLDRCSQVEGSLGWKVHQLWTAIGEQLDAYHKALLQHNQLSQLPTPTHAEVNSVWNFLRNNDLHRDHGQGENMFMAFPENSVWKVGIKRKGQLDPESLARRPPDFALPSEDPASFTPNHWSRHEKVKEAKAKVEPIEEDLVTINASTEPPIHFAQHLRDRITDFYCRTFYRNHPKDMYGGLAINGQVFERIIDTLVLMLSCIVPTVSIIVLHYIQSQVWRLGFISFWAAGFSLCLSYFTGATHIQIFSASLGMAAVQVVFISNGINGAAGSGAVGSD